MAKKGLSPFALTLAPPGTHWHQSSSTYTYSPPSHDQNATLNKYVYNPPSHDQDAALNKYVLLRTPTTVVKPESTILFSELFRLVERANVRNRGSEPPRLDLLRRDDNDDACDLSLAPPSQGKGKGKVNGKIPTQESYFEMKKQRKERSVRVEADHGQEIKKRKVTAKDKEIKNIKTSKPQNRDGIEAISVTSFPSSAGLSSYPAGQF